MTACMCGDSQCPSCDVAQGTLEYPTEAEMNRAYAAEPKPCHTCGATDHAFCGFCSRCKEHTTFISGPCEPCNGQGIVLKDGFRSTSQNKPCPDCRDSDGWTEPLS